LNHSLIAVDRIDPIALEEKVSENSSSRTARPPTMQEASDIMNPSLPEDDVDEDQTEEETGPELEIERDNEFYTINGRAFQYMDNPIELKLNGPVRIYLLSMTEFDPMNSFHLHSGMFNYTSSGILSTPPTLTDIVTIGQGDRGIIEFKPQYTGTSMSSQF
jgi:FtsP/CotA-like multicopper oxidase with cupredoxin domain